MKKINPFCMIYILSVERFWKGEGFICLKAEKYGIIVLMHKNTIYG